MFKNTKNLQYKHQISTLIVLDDLMTINGDYCCCQLIYNLLSDYRVESLQGYILQTHYKLLVSISYVSYYL